MVLFPATGCRRPKFESGMTTINRIMELAGAKNEGYARYLRSLPEFQLQERLRILEEEAAAGRESRGWRTAKHGQLEMLPVIAAKVAALPARGNGDGSVHGQTRGRDGRTPGEGLPDLGEILREARGARRGVGKTTERESEN